MENSIVSIVSNDLVISKTYVRNELMDQERRR